MSNWANRTKAAATAVPLETKSKDRGTRHVGVLEAITPTVYSTGSFGLKVKYSVEGLERAVYENIVLRTMNAEGNYTATKYGESSLKRRLAAFGLSNEDIAAFAIPKTPKDVISADLVGAPVALYLADREYMGKTYKDVKSVWPADE